MTRTGTDRLLPAGVHYLQGAQACAEGAITAGCRVYAGYPITPATEIMSTGCGRSCPRSTPSSSPR
jgi:TPP-dependent indolepyruvate ferredoxin oxidoreductase alpha subunit